MSGTKLLANEVGVFRDGEQISDGGGEGLANLFYRLTALYTGHDDVLGARVLFWRDGQIH